MTAPAITVKTFPYRRKWTQAQVDEISARKDRLAGAMTDAVGPAGQQLYVDAAHIHILALHLALAGGEVRDELAYITAEIINSPGAPASFHHWHLKSEYTPAPPDPDETKRKAAAAAEQIRRQLSPEVRREVAAMMREEYEKATREDDPDDVGATAV
jgi:hypothetical protein